MKRGKFIVFEGTDGSGKSTQMKLLKEELSRRGIPVYCTHEPTDSPIGSVLRAALTGKIEANEHSIALMFAADRVDHIQNAVYGMEQKLKEGVTVLCDRYYLSSFAYNGGFVPLEWVIELNRPAMERLRPDLTLFLDVSVEECMRRVQRRGEAERYESCERQTLIRAKYFELFERFKETEHVVVIPSEARREETQNRVKRAALALFGEEL